MQSLLSECFSFSPHFSNFWSSFTSPLTCLLLQEHFQPGSGTSSGSHNAPSLSHYSLHYFICDHVFLSLFPPYAELHEVREWDNLVHRSPVQLLAHCTLLALCTNQSFNEWINQMWYLPKVKRFQTFEDRNSDTCHNTGEPWGQYAKWNRPFTKYQIQDNLIFRKYSSI